MHGVLRVGERESIVSEKQRERRRKQKNHKPCSGTQDETNLLNQT